VVGVNAHSTCRLGIARQHVLYLNALEISRSHSCPWVALGRVGSRFSVFGVGLGPLQQEY